jgi:hypothetical protein
MSNVKHGPEHVPGKSTEELTHGSPYVGPDAPAEEQPLTGTVIQAGAHCPAPPLQPLYPQIHSYYDSYSHTHA